MLELETVAREAIRAYLVADRHAFADLRETLTDHIGETATQKLLRETLADAA